MQYWFGLACISLSDCLAAPGLSTEQNIHSEGCEQDANPLAPPVFRFGETSAIWRTGASLAYVPQQFRKDREASQGGSIVCYNFLKKTWIM